MRFEDTCRSLVRGRVPSEECTPLLHAAEAHTEVAFSSASDPNIDPTVTRAGNGMLLMGLLMRVIGIATMDSRFSPEAIVMN